MADWTSMPFEDDGMAVLHVTKRIDVLDVPYTTGHIVRT